MNMRSHHVGCPPGRRQPNSRVARDRAAGRGAARIAESNDVHAAVPLDHAWRGLQTTPLRDQPSGSVPTSTSAPSAIQRKLSISTVESHSESPVSQIVKRIVTSLPPWTGAVVTNQLVAPASSHVSKPVPSSSAVPSPQPEHTSKYAMLTLTGLPSESNEMLPSIDPTGAGSTSAMYWSLYEVHTHSGYSNE